MWGEVLRTLTYELKSCEKPRSLFVYMVANVGETYNSLIKMLDPKTNSSHLLDLGVEYILMMMLALTIKDIKTLNLETKVCSFLYSCL